jgi:hypothetical protein
LTNFSAAEWLEETSQFGEGRKFLKVGIQCLLELIVIEIPTFSKKL